jgi:uncharacterized membrane protein YkvA (DUF1232 family)
MNKSKPGTGTGTESGQDNVTILRDLMRHGKQAWSLMSDRRVPAKHKLIPAAAIAYLVSPIDLLPELAIFGVGYIDDVAILLLALRWFNRLAGEHVAAIDQGESVAIDADYRVGEPLDGSSEPII